MIKFIDKDYDSDFYEFELNGAERPDSMGDALWSDGKIVQINPCYMDGEQWGELKRVFSNDDLRGILGLFRQTGYSNIPYINEIERGG